MIIALMKQQRMPCEPERKAEEAAAETGRELECSQQGL
jgi:hypothetical protein